MCKNVTQQNAHLLFIRLGPYDGEIIQYVYVYTGVLYLYVCLYATTIASAAAAVAHIVAAAVDGAFHCFHVFFSQC